MRKCGRSKASLDVFLFFLPQKYGGKWVDALHVLHAAVGQQFFYENGEKVGISLIKKLHAGKSFCALLLLFFGCCHRCHLHPKGRKDSPTHHLDAELANLFSFPWGVGGCHRTVSKRCPKEGGGGIWPMQHKQQQRFCAQGTEESDTHYFHYFLATEIMS